MASFQVCLVRAMQEHRKRKLSLEIYEDERKADGIKFLKPLLNNDTLYSCSMNTNEKQMVKNIHGMLFLTGTHKGISKLF